LQVALASTMAMATIAATINAGGLGQLLFEGLQGQQLAPILWGTLFDNGFDPSLCGGPALA
jgi:ABC-type proline/glycine betaine transport systems, permease component